MSLLSHAGFTGEKKSWEKGKRKLGELVGVVCTYHGLVESVEL
jgi:hypothetical protein